MSVFDDPFTPWGEIVSFGNPWHGYLQSGNLFRLDGAAMTLPSGVQHFAGPDGGARLVDLGMPAVVTSASEQAQGMTWWHKAILAGSGIGSSRTYNPVRATGAPALLFRQGAWPYRCADGTTYVIWYSPGSDQKIRAEIAGYPSGSGVPGNITGGTVRLDVSGLVAQTRVVGASTYTLYWWINFAPNGSKAALHTGYVNGQHYTYQIIEFAVAGGDATMPPTVTQTSLRSLETGGGLLTDFNQGVPYAEYQGPNDVLPVSQPTGDDIQRSTLILCVDYNAASERIELGTKTESVFTFSPFINGAGHSDVSSVGDSSYRITRNGSPALTVTHWTATKASNASASVVTHVRFPALGSVDLVYGQLLVLSNPAISLSSDGKVVTGVVSIFGIVGSNAVAEDGTSSIAAGYTTTDVAVNPQTGSFSVGRTRYF